MSDLQKYIANRKQTDKEFAEGYDAGYEALKLGAIVKELRLNSGMTQEELAKKLNTKKTVVSRMENHATDMRFSTLAKVANVFGKKLQIGIQ
jgi:ribosome-binding protein aMBF1 (putative translation factor)